MSFDDYTITHTVSAAPETVWTAFTDPGWMRRWMWGPASDVQAEADVRPGGYWRCSLPTLERDSGRERDSQRGLYMIVERPTRLSFTLNWDEANVIYNPPGSNVLDELIDVQFAPADGGGTTISLTHYGVPHDDGGQSAAAHKEAIGETLVLLGKLLDEA